jgi:DnaJ-class molecular chaperone
MEKMRDPYEVLGLPYGASTAEIRAAWREAARTFHPDSSGQRSTENTIAFMQAREAYTQLISAVRTRESTRSHYDSEEANFDTDTSAAPGSGYDPADENIPLEDLPAHDPFTFWPGPPRVGEPLKVVAHITLREAIFGSVKVLRVKYAIPHAQCSGVPQPGCACAGTGEEMLTAQLAVKIPASTPDSTVIKLPRRGSPGWGGAMSGDLTVTVRVDRDPIWVVRGRDTYASVDITTASAWSGSTLAIPHPLGVVEVEVPPQTHEPFTREYPGAGIDGKGYVTVTPLALDMQDQGTLDALAQLDLAQRETMMREG